MVISMEISWPEERDRSIAHVGLPSVGTGAARRRPEAPPKPPRVYQSADLWAVDPEKPDRLTI